MQVTRSYALVIGCGSIGKRHINNLISIGINKIYAVDLREDRLDEIRGLEGVIALSTLKEVPFNKLTSGLICTPPSSHIKLADLLLRNHCPRIFIEKPLAHDYVEAKRLMPSVLDSKSIVAVGCNYRFHPAIQLAKKNLDKGTIGKIYNFRSEFGQYLPDWHPWEDYSETYSAIADMGGGIALDRIHELDYLRYLLGELSVKYSNVSRVGKLNINTEDNVDVILQTLDGVVGTLHLDYLRRDYTAGLNIVGELGTISGDIGKNGYFSLYDSKIDSLETISFDSEKYDLNQMYRDEIKAFFDITYGEHGLIQNYQESLELVLQVEQIKSEFNSNS